MKGFLLDTDTCIFFLRGKYQLEKKIDAIGKDNCFVSEITVAELLFGAEFSQYPEKHLQEVISFERNFEVIPIYNALKLYSKEKARLWRAGNKIAEFDLLIGTTAVVHDLVAVTNNEKHFNRIEGIRIENWTVKKFNEFL